MRQGTGPALVQVMAYRLFGAKPLPETMLTFVNRTIRNKIQWNSNQNLKLFIPKNAFANIVCEMEGILSREKWVNHCLKYKYCCSVTCNGTVGILPHVHAPFCQISAIKSSILTTRDADDTDSEHGLFWWRLRTCRHKPPQPPGHIRRCHGRSDRALQEESHSTARVLW